ncbi:MbnP family protein [uncultured Microscilla sp.]|uniref:MbnP family protein n=1 Tax=uncultured Microscilla sp. TaxID=432653 RepID=UPI00262A8F95|nr:MbnP family protein [uncultured Microscilla sp.]
MKSLNILIISILSIALFAACKKEDAATPASETGQMILQFDNKVGSEELNLTESGGTVYPYKTASGQTFNITKMGYYISKIKLETEDGTVHEDEVNVSANAAEVKGYYHVLESNSSSQLITLKNIPAGKYTKVTFTIGVDEDGVQEGAAGGVLDPAEGAWFWNWNAGYIGFAIEGASPNSSQKEVVGEGWKIHEKSFALHVGGWKDVAPASGQTQKFVNNVKTLTLALDSPITVSEKLQPKAHIVVDALKVLDGVNIDFATSYAIHAPALGKPLAEQLSNAFILHHVHQ